MFITCRPTGFHAAHAGVAFGLEARETLRADLIFEVVDICGIEAGGRIVDSGSGAEQAAQRPAALGALGECGAHGLDNLSPMIALFAEGIVSHIINKKSARLM